VLVSPSPVLACYEYTAEATPMLSTPNRASSAWGVEAEESSMAGVRLAAAGLASLGLVAMAFRVLSRAKRRSMVVEPDRPVEGPSPFLRPGSPGIRIDPGHERLEPAGAGRGEEALSGALAMH
jgi:hypothetical protein